MSMHIAISISKDAWLNFVERDSEHPTIALVKPIIPIISELPFLKSVIDGEMKEMFSIHIIDQETNEHLFQTSFAEILNIVKRK